MTYFTNLLRQSAARIGPVRRAARKIDGIEVDVVRVARAPSSKAAPTATVGRRRATPGHIEPEPAAGPEARPAVPSIDRGAPVVPEGEPPALPPVSPLPPSPPRAELTRVADPASPREDPPRTTAHEAHHARDRRDSIARRKPEEIANERRVVERLYVAPEERALRSVAEVVAWVESGAEVDALTTTAMVEPAPQPNRSQRIEDDRPLRDASPRAGAPVRDTTVETRERDLKERDVTVSVGTIDITVEDPAGLAAVPQPAARPVEPDPEGASASRLWRHYVRL